MIKPQSVHPARDEGTIRCWSCAVLQFDRPGRMFCVRCRKVLRPPTSATVMPAVEPKPSEPEPSEAATRALWRFRQIRVAKGLAQREIAAALRVPRTYITKLERGIVLNPHQGTLPRLAAALGVQVDDLLSCEPVSEVATRTVMYGGSGEEIVQAVAEALPGLSEEQRRGLLLRMIRFARSHRRRGRQARIGA